MRPPIMLVCGSRNYTDKAKVWKILDSLVGPWILMHGDASGADAFARSWAGAHEHPQIIVPARWKAEGRGAGPLRNREMVRWFRPDEILAFPKSGQWSPGTRDMIELGIKHNIRTVVYSFDDSVTVHFNA